LEFRRVLFRSLQRDLPHLPIVVDDAAVTVGPLVDPGASACLHCAALHRRDADPAWPAIAAQLVHRAPPAPHPVRTAAAVPHAARIVATALPGAGEQGRELRISVDGEQLSERPIAPHPECRCATPPESDWVRAASSASPSRTSAARASAAHA